MNIPPLSLGLIKGANRVKLIDDEAFAIGQAHGLLYKAGAHTPVHALSGRLQAGPNGGVELTVPSSLIKGVFDALNEPGAEFVVRNNRTEAAIKVMTKAEVDKVGGANKITERGHSYNYTLGPIIELPASGDYEKLWAISIESNNLEDIRKSYGLETSPQLGFYIPVGIKKKNVTKENGVSKLAESACVSNSARFSDHDGKVSMIEYRKYDVPKAEEGPVSKLASLLKQAAGWEDKGYSWESKPTSFLYNGERPWMAPIGYKIKGNKPVGEMTFEEIAAAMPPGPSDDELKDYYLGGLNKKLSDPYTPSVRAHYQTWGPAKRKLTNLYGLFGLPEDYNDFDYDDITNKSTPAQRTEFVNRLVSMMNGGQYKGRTGDFFAIGEPELSDEDNDKRIDAWIASRTKNKGKTKLAGSVPSQDEVYSQFIKNMGSDYDGKLIHVSGGLPDASKLSDVDVGYITPDYKNLLDKLPKGSAVSHKDGRSIYNIPGYSREVGLFATDNPDLVNRSKTHRENELALAVKFPELAAKAAELKKGGMGTEEAWANVLGLKGDPYEAMLGSNLMDGGVQKLAGLLKKMAQPIAGPSPNPYPPASTQQPPANGSDILSGFSPPSSPAVSSSGGEAPAPSRSASAFRTARSMGVEPAISGAPLIGGALPMSAAAVFNSLMNSRYMQAGKYVSAVPMIYEGVTSGGKAVVNAPNDLRNAAMSAVLPGHTQGGQQAKQVGWSDMFPNTKEVPFSVTTGDAGLLKSVGSTAWGLGKEMAGHGLYKGLEAYSNSPTKLKNPLFYPLQTQAAVAASKPVVGAGLNLMSGYKDPRYVEVLRRQAHRPDGLAGSIEDIAKGVAQPPLNIKLNPHFFKEVADTHTPNLGLAAYNALLGNREQEIDRQNMYNRMMDNRGGGISQLGRPFSTPPVRIRQQEPWLKRTMTDSAAQFGKNLSNNLIPPRPAGQEAPTMFPQINKAIQAMGANSAYGL